jgi:MFS family permease
MNALRISRTPSIAFVIVGLYWGAFAAFVPVLKDGLGASDALFGLLLLGTSTGLVSAMWLAPRVDRILGPRGMQVATVFLIGSFLLPGLATTPFLFTCSMALAGMSSGLLDVVMNARVSELEARHEKSLMNANHAMFSVGYSVAALGTGFAREAGLAPIAVFAIIGVVTLLMSTRLWMPAEEVSEVEGEVRSFPLVPILLCGALVMIAFMSEATVEQWSALHIERTLFGGAAEGALGPATLGLTMAIGRFSGQAVSERLSDYAVIVWATLISVAGTLLAATAATPMIAYLGFGIMGLGVSVIGPIGLALVGCLVAPRYRTEAISKAAVMGFAGFFIAPMLMGLMSQAFGLRFAFACVALLLLMALPLLVVIRRLPKR